jgi:hypothetical protein
MPSRVTNRKLLFSFSSQAAGGISMKTAQECSLLSLVGHITARSALLHKMATRALNRKFLSGFYMSSCCLNNKETPQKQSVPSFIVHFTSVFLFTAQIDHQSYK